MATNPTVYQLNTISEYLDKFRSKLAALSNPDSVKQTSAQILADLAELKTSIRELESQFTVSKNSLEKKTRTVAEGKFLEMHGIFLELQERFDREKYGIEARVYPM